MRILTALIIILFLSVPAGTEVTKKNHAGIKLLQMPFVSAPSLSPLAGRATMTMSKLLEQSGIFEHVRENHGITGGKDGNAWTDLNPARESARKTGAEKLLLCRIEYRKRITERKLAEYVTERKGADLYLIRVRSIDVKSGAMDIGFDEKTGRKSDIDLKVREITEKIIEYYRTRRSPEEPGFGLEPESIGFAPLFVYSIGSYRGLGRNGPGASLDVNFRVLPSRTFLFSGRLDCYRFLEKKESIRSITALGLSVLLLWDLRVTGNLSLRPGAGTGFLFHRIEGDPDGMDRNGSYDHTVCYYRNPSVSLLLDMDLATAGRYHLFLVPRYTLFFESDERKAFLSFQAGVRYVFR